MAINQISTVALDERTDKKQVKYLSKDFSDFKKNLVEFTKFYFADTYQDFSDASPGSIFIDMASYIGDVLSYYTDHSFKENLLAHAEEKENIDEQDKQLYTEYPLQELLDEKLKHDPKATVIEELSPKRLIY